MPAPNLYKNKRQKHLNVRYDFLIRRQRHSLDNSRACALDLHAWSFSFPPASASAPQPCCPPPPDLLGRHLAHLLIQQIIIVIRKLWHHHNYPCYYRIYQFKISENSGCYPSLRNRWSFTLALKLLENYIASSLEDEVSLTSFWYSFAQSHAYQWWLQKLESRSKLCFCVFFLALLKKH